MRSIVFSFFVFCAGFLPGQSSNFGLNLRLGIPHEIASNDIQPGLFFGGSISYDIPVRFNRGLTLEAGVSQVKFYSVAEVIGANNNFDVINLTTGFRVRMLETSLRLGYFQQYGRLTFRPYVQLNATFGGDAAYLYTLAPARGNRTEIAGDLTQADLLYEQPFNNTVIRGDDFEQVSLYYPYSIHLGLSLQFALTEAYSLGVEYSIPTTWMGRHAVGSLSSICAPPGTRCSDISPNLRNGGRAKTRYGLVNLVVGYRF